MALGCWPFAGGMIWGEQDEGESIATVHAALDAGINFFDTAEGYEEGRSERVLGRGLAGRRQQAVIASKVSPNHLTPKGIAAACEQSLKNLQTDYIDLYQIHWPDHDIPIETSWRAFEDLLAAGKVRALGVANFASNDLADLVAVSQDRSAGARRTGRGRDRTVAAERPSRPGRHAGSGAAEHYKRTRNHRPRRPGNVR